MSELEPGRPEAAAAVWSWRPVAVPRPDPGPARWRGCLQAAVGFAVAALLFAFGPRLPAAIVATIATTIALAALLSPLGLFAAIERAVAALGLAIGNALTWILLPAIFFGFFVPFALLFRRGRRDAMKRWFEPDAASYWSQREDASSHSASASHERQY